MAKRKKGWDGTERRAPAMVLVSGPEDPVNELLSRILRSHGYRTVTADSHEAATARATDQLPRAALVDLSSGSGADLRLLDWFRNHDDERLARCRVIVIAKTAANRTFAFQSGADDYLQRPFHADELVEALRAALETPQDQLAIQRRDKLKAVPG